MSRPRSTTSNPKILPRKRENPRASTKSIAGGGGGKEEEEEETPIAGGGGRKEEETAIAGGGEIASAAGGNSLEKQYWKYVALYKAALRGDWNEAKGIIDKDIDALRAQITQDGETALQVAVGAGKSTDFVKELVNLMPVEALKLCDDNGRTALNTAARFGNTKAAEILVQKHPDLLYIRNFHNWLPVHQAAVCAHKETLAYLLTVTKDDHQYMPFAGQSGVELLIRVISSGFYDIAFSLVHRCPHAAQSNFQDNGSFRCALGEMAKKVSAFPSGKHWKYWEILIYPWVPVKLKNHAIDHNEGDIENPSIISQAQKYCCARFLGGSFSISVRQKLQDMLWKVLEILVPHIKHIRQQKLMHHQALQLVKCLCDKIARLKNLEAYRSLAKGPLLVAASLGIHEIVEEIVDSFPRAITAWDSENHNIFELAVIHRQENVFNLLYQMSEYKQFVTQHIDEFGNTLLHLAGKLATPNKLNLIPGAALQMQRELQWFKEVEKFVGPSFVEHRNNKGETPSEIFTKEHEDLVIKGEEWMKARANSCTIVAALIVTVIFASAITIPGGNNNRSGLPIFFKEKAFMVFSSSNAIALFTSTTSLLIFLSILTSRYAEDDFLHVLPKRLIFGFVTLFLSITTMIIAFSSILYLMFGQNTEWILIPVAALACLPITSFVSLQFPLLVDLMSSTYGRGIFGKQSSQDVY